MLYAAVVAATLSLGYYVGRVTNSASKNYTTQTTGNLAFNDNPNAENKIPSIGDGDISGLGVDPLDECKMVQSFSWI